MSKFSSILPSAAEMQMMDESCIKSGTSSLTLMERAGQAVFENLNNLLTPNQNYSILILCGPGNNGGDGLVLARLLAEHKLACRVVLVSAAKYSADNRVNLKALADQQFQELYLFAIDPPALDLQLPIVDRQTLIEFVSKADVIVDALLGTGQSTAPRGVVADMLEVVAKQIKQSALKIAVDVPTGINCDRGVVYKDHFTATHTFCIQFIKRGLLQYPAKSHCGEIFALDIGIPSSVAVKYQRLVPEELPVIKRTAIAHKGSSGRLLVIGSEAGMPGATVLACQAALRAGAGLVTRVAPAKALRPIECWPEVMHKLVGDSEHFHEASINDLLVDLKNVNAIVVGPGMTTQPATMQFVKALLEQTTCPVVIDAGALAAFTKSSMLIGTAQKNWVLTPHPGELAQMLACGSSEIQADRYAAFDKFTALCRAVLVLKGASSIVGDHTRAWVNTTGNSAMASGGMGDVLSGIIGAFLAQGLETMDAACLAVYIHGLVADNLLKKRNAPIIASDIFIELEKVLARDFFDFEN